MTLVRTTLLLGVTLVILTGCNLVIGTEDHEAYPADCGAESLANAQNSFSDERNGHCYALVRTDDEENGTDFSTAKDSCTEAGGALACVNDAEELDLMARNVQARPWLGMNARAAANLETFRCITGERFAPDFTAWADGHPNSDEGGSCTILVDGRVVSRWCGNGIDFWLCELAPPSGE
jgi:hypothetical protein